MSAKNPNPPVQPDAQARAPGEGQTGAHAQILQFLQKLHFRRVLFGGLDEQSVWQALRKLKDEVPHGIAVLIDEMHQRKTGIWDIKATIVCERDAHKGIIIGKGGAMLKRIGTGARIQIERMTEDKVNLQLFVKVRKDWRDSDTFLKNYGFKDET